MNARKFLAAAGGVLVAGILAFAPLAGNSFVQFDDQLYIVENPYVRSGMSLSNLRWALTSAHASNWHPLTWLSHQLDVELFGLNAGRHHLMALALHLASALGMLVLLQRMTGMLWRSALVAALFALHPLHVESVAWASERKDLLAALFWVATTAAYLGYVRAPGRCRYLAVLSLFALGLAAKPMLVTLPLVLLLLDSWPLGRLRPFRAAVSQSDRDGRLWRLILEKVPLLTLAAASSALTLWAQGGNGALYPLTRLPLAVRLANAATAAVAYLGKMLLPLRLSYFYPLDPGGNLWWEAVACSLLLAGLTAVALRLGNRPWLAVGWLWYGVTLLPVIGVVQVGTQALADRYTYLPLTGVFIAIVWCAAEGLKARPAAVRGLGAVAALAILGAATALTHAQTKTWRDTGSLAEHALKLDPGNWLALSDRGVALSQQGRNLEARAALERSLERYPGYDAGHNNLGVVELRLGRPERAVQLFDQTLALNPRYREAWLNRAVALVLLGRVAEAESSFQRLLEMDSGSAEAHKGLGNIRLNQGRYAEALAHFRASLRLRPDFAEVWNNLGVAAMALGRRDEALAAYREALRLRPGFAEARQNLSLMLRARKGVIASPTPDAGGRR